MQYFCDDFALVVLDAQYLIPFQDHPLNIARSQRQALSRHENIIFVYLNWLRISTNPSWLDTSIGRAAIQKPENASLNPVQDNEFFVVFCSVRLIMNLVFHIFEDGLKTSSVVLQTFYVDIEN